MKDQFRQLKERLGPALQPAVEWYRSRESREQRVLVLLVVTVVLLLAWSLVWQPAWNLREREMLSWQQNTRLLGWIQANAEEVRKRGGNGRAADAAVVTGDLTAILSRSAGAAGLQLKSINAEGADTARIQLENAPFAESLAWLDSLATQGLQVVSAEFVPGSGPGVVNLRATLRRPS